MKDFLNKLLTLFLFILSVGLFYLSASISFPTAFINIALFVIAIFVLLQGCANVDKENGYGKYSAHNNEQNPNPNPPADSNDDKPTEAN